jgi:hypothetical protein
MNRELLNFYFQSFSITMFHRLPSATLREQLRHREVGVNMETLMSKEFRCPKDNQKIFMVSIGRVNTSSHFEQSS